MTYNVFGGMLNLAQFQAGSLLGKCDLTVFVTTEIFIIRRFVIMCVVLYRHVSVIDGVLVRICT